MRRITRTGVSLLAAFLFIAIIAGAIFAIAAISIHYGKAEEPSESGSRAQIRIYSSLQEIQLSAVEELFEKLNPDIDLVCYSAGTGKILTKVEAEIQSGALSADMIWIGDPYSYAPLLDSDLLSPIDSEYRNDIPAWCDFDDDRLITARLVVMGFAYNAHEYPSGIGWDSFLDSGSFAIADPATSGTSLYSL